MRFRVLLAMCLLVFSSAALSARASDAVACSQAGLSIRLLPGEECWVLGQNLGSGSGTSVGPIRLVSPMAHPRYQRFKLVSAASGCEPGTITIQYANTDTGDAPGIWSTITALTGVVDPLQSEYDTGPVVFGPVFRATFATISDAECTVAGIGNVSIVLIQG